MALSATSWGNWSDGFAKDDNRHFVVENITAIGLKQLDANAVIVSDLSGRFLAAAALDLESGRPLDLDLVRGAVLDANFPWREHLRQGRDASGSLQTDRGVLMLVASPILDGFGHGPARGSVVMGKLLSASQVRQIGAQAQARLAMLPPRRAGAGRMVETADVTQVCETFNGAGTVRQQAISRLSRSNDPIFLCKSLQANRAAPCGPLLGQGQQDALFHRWLDTRSAASFEPGKDGRLSHCLCDPPRASRSCAENGRRANARTAAAVRIAFDPFVQGAAARFIAASWLVSARA